MHFEHLVTEHEPEPPVQMQVVTDDQDLEIGPDFNWWAHQLLDQLL